MVAVLPFDNLSSEGDAYFADGMTEDITTALSCFHSLQVIARGSSFVYRGRDVPDTRNRRRARSTIPGARQRAASRPESADQRSTPRLARAGSTCGGIDTIES